MNEPGVWLTVIFTQLVGGLIHTDQHNTKLTSYVTLQTDTTLIILKGEINLLQQHKDN